MLSVDDFVRQLIDSGLVSADDIRAIRAKSSVATQGETVKTLATELVRAGKLTKYQATAVWQEKGSDLFVGNYVILDVIGRGGMGSVYKAEHRRLKRLVAIKMLNPASLNLADAVDRFNRETEVVGKLKHRNIVAAFDAGEANGRHFLVMEYCDGVDLDRLVTDQGPLPPQVAAACVLQAARGLENAHASGVLHRDVKPANLLLVTENDRPVVKLLDLGLAWSRDSSAGKSGDASGRLTENDRIMGTVTYMAPEQALEIHSADQRSDIYSLGCTFYFLATGRVIYDGDSVLKRLVAHREAPIPDLPGASAPLNAVHRKMVAKRPEDRFASMGEVISALEACGVTDVQAGGALDLSKVVAPSASRREPSSSSVSLSRNEPLAPAPGGLKSPKSKGAAKKKGARQSENKPLVLLIAGGLGTAILLVGAIAVWMLTQGSTDPVAAAPAMVAADVPVNPAGVAAAPSPSTQENSTSPVAATTATAMTSTTPTPSVADSDINIVGEYVGSIVNEPWGFQVRRREGHSFSVRILKGGLPGDGWDQQTAYDLTASLQAGQIVFDKNPRLAGVFEPDQLAGTNALGEPFVAKKTVRRSSTLEQPAASGATLLFDGQTVDQWTAGVLTPDGFLNAGATSKGASRDFSLHLEYRLPAAETFSASVRQLSLALQGRYELLIADSFGEPVTATSCTAIVGGDFPSLNLCFPAGEWQTLDIAFVAPRFDPSGVKSANARCTVRHNGVLVHDNVELRTATVGQETPAPGPLVLGASAESGIVFRNIWILEKRPTGLLSASQSDWPAPSEAMQKRVKAAAGMLHPNFAFVQTLQFEHFTEIAEGLQEAGYRPVRLRPYAGNNGVQAAALWTRDGYEWRTSSGDASESRKQAAELLAAGLWPEDIAGFATKTGESYVTLWARLPENPAEEVRLFPGVRHLSLQSTFGGLPDQGFAERIDQAFTSKGVLTLHSTLWWKSPTRTQGWFGDAAYYEGQAKGFQIDLCIGRGPITGGPAYSWCSLVDPPAGAESTELHGLAPDVHLKRCGELAEQGYRPVVIGTAHVTGPTAIQSCSVWHRRKQ